MTAPPPPAELQPLVDRWLQGDARAADALFATLYPRVLRFFELHATAVAADLTHRTLLACFEAQKTIRDADAFPGFVFGVARRQLFRYLREKDRGEKIRASVAAVARDASTSLSTVYARTHEQRLLLQALVELPTEQSMLLGLYYWEGLRATDIAQSLEVPSSTITTRLARAREALRKEIELAARQGRARASLLEDLETWLASLSDDEKLASVVRPPR